MPSSSSGSSVNNNDDDYYGSYNEGNKKDVIPMSNNPLRNMKKKAPEQPVIVDVASECTHMVLCTIFSFNLFVNK